MADLSIIGAELRAVGTALTSAIGAFGAAGRAASNADYGSESVSAAAAELSAALRRATGAVEERSNAGAHWASSAATEFAALDVRIAAAVSA